VLSLAADMVVLRNARDGMLPWAVLLAIALLPIANALARDTVDQHQPVVGPSTWRGGRWTTGDGQRGWRDPGDDQAEAPPRWDIVPGGSPP